jgi:hypothetical protein
MQGATSPSRTGIRRAAEDRKIAQAEANILP